MALVLHESCDVLMCLQVFLHPASALHKAAPQRVVFSQLVQTDKRIYMTGAAC